MLKNQVVEIYISPANYKHFENKGYKINHYIDKSNTKRVKKELIKVKAEDLPSSSHALVKVKCANCENIINKEYRHAIKGSNFCNAKCKGEYMSKSNLKSFEKLISEKASTYLYREYIGNKKPLRQISREIYGHENNYSSIGYWCERLEIPLRHGKEAVETQWINNDSRRKMQRDLIIKNLNIIENNERFKNYEEYRKTSDYYKWRLSVWARDNFTCIKCSKKRDANTMINAHHLESFKNNIDLRFDVDNGVTLCESCHIKFHAKYTNRNNTKEQFEEFIKAD